MQKLQPLIKGYKRVVQFTNKVVLVLAVLFAISGIFIYLHKKDLNQSHPQINHTEVYRAKLYEQLNSKELLESPNGPLLRGIIRGVYCFTIGEACTENPSDGDIHFQNSLFGRITGVFAAPYTNPPASGIAWVNSKLQDAGFVPASYAQGIGFNSLNAYENIWKLFRNLTYFVLAVAIVVVGFLIMFRYQIDSNTVVSIENSLPRFVITLLMITFSFAIAGFMVDLMYIIMLLSFELFGSLQVSGMSTERLQQLYLLNNMPVVTSEFLDARFLNFYIQGIQAFVKLIPDWIRIILYSALNLWLTFLFADALFKGSMLKELLADLKVKGGIVAFMVEAGVANAIVAALIIIILAIFIPLFIQIILPFLIGLLVMLALFFRIIFLLLNAYIRIVIDIIFAPIFLLPNVVPGNNSFGSWIKRLFGNMLCFPLTIILLIVVQLIAVNDEAIGFWGLNSGLNQFTLPPLNLDTSQLVPIITAAFLLLIPELVRTAQEAIAGKPVISAGPGALLAGVGGTANLIAGGFGNLAMVSRMFDEGSGLYKVFNFLGFGRKGRSDRKNAPPPPVLGGGSES